MARLIDEIDFSINLKGLCHEDFILLSFRQNYNYAIIITGYNHVIIMLSYNYDYFMIDTFSFVIQQPLFNLQP